jgi:putative FmdB family regulatory protein
VPIYEYTCSDCGSEFELLLRSSAAPVSCPECSGGHVTKRFSLFAVGGARGGREGPSSTAAESNGCAHCHSRHCSTCH